MGWIVKQFPLLLSGMPVLRNCYKWSEDNLRESNKIETRVIVFFDLNSMMHHDSVPAGQFVDVAIWNVIDCLIQIRWEYLSWTKWTIGFCTITLLKHIVIVKIYQFMTQKTVAIIHYATYSHHLAQAHFIS